MILHFDTFTLNTDTFELAAEGTVRPVEPLVFDLLALLARHPDRVFSRDELIDEIWEGRAVTDATVSTCVKNARKALGDSGNSQKFLRTVRGRGFRFAAPVTRDDAPSQAVAARDDRTADSSLLILRFRNLTDDDSRQAVEALPQRLNAIMTRVPLLKLSALGGLYDDEDQQPTAREIHRDLAVDFVVEGVVEKVDGGLRTTVQLADARTGFSLWAESFPLTPDAVDACVAAIVGKLEPQLHRAMYDAVRSRDGAPSARELFLEASGILVTQGWHHESFVEAEKLLRRSAALDPTLALAPALLSLLIGFGSRLGLASDQRAAADEVVEWAERALRADGMDSTVLGFAGCSLADVGHTERGESLLRNALELNPTNAQALVALGAIRMSRNALTEAVQLLGKGIEISPVDSRLSVWGALLAVALLLSGDAAAAAAAAETACDRNDRTYLPRIALAGARMVEGDADAALVALAEARRIKSDLASRQVEALLGPKLSARLLELEARAGR